MNDKIKKILFGFLLFFPLFAFSQFVEEPAVVHPINEPAIQAGFKFNKLFDFFIIISALIFMISIFGFLIGFLKLITSGGDEKTAQEASNMLVFSGWLFGSSIAIYLLVNIIKFFVY